MTRDADGFAPIASYGVLGDGRTVALVAADGEIDWWPLPALDSPPAFAAILDPQDGGHLTLRPATEFTTTRRYAPGTNVLETTFHTAAGEVRVTDALSVGAAGPLPWGELVRRVDGVAGRVEMRWAVAPGDRFRATRPWAEWVGDLAIMHVGDQHLAVQGFDIGESSLSEAEVSGSFTTSPGSRGLLAITTSDAEPLSVPERDLLDGRLDRTVSRGRDWSEGVRYDGPWREAVLRSALALRVLSYSPTGAIAAAPTTSLPERIGGDKNWDYRFMWVRDASFTVCALMSLGLHEEVQAAVSFLLDLVGRTAPDVHVFYTLGGDVADGTADVDLPGYRNSRPVRVGNGAARQTQLGNFGDLFDAVWHYTRHGHVLDAATGKLLEQLADRCCDVWSTPDSGIWELDTDRHYTISKMGCWVALDRAVRLVDSGMIDTGGRDRWDHERDAIKSWIDEHCWSHEKASYTFYAGADDLDAATLLAGRTGFDLGERLEGTIRAVRKELGVGPLLFRYTGVQEQEGAFLACTFWMVDALANLGHAQEAGALMDEAVALTNDVGLLSEQMDPATGELLGNFPQGLSHLALINAATALADLERRGIA